MINQMVLRGGSLATPPGHARRELPKLLPSRQALAVHRPAAGARRLTGHPMTYDEEARPDNPACCTCAPALIRQTCSASRQSISAVAATAPHDPGGSVAAAALQGLLAPRKTLPPALFYDEEGCRLFYEITRLPEYYLTRTEFRLLQTTAPEVAAQLPPGATWWNTARATRPRPKCCCDRPCAPAVQRGRTYSAPTSRSTLPEPQLRADARAAGAAAAGTDRHAGCRGLSCARSRCRERHRRGGDHGVLPRIDDRQPGTGGGGRLPAPRRGSVWAPARDSCWASIPAATRNG